MVVSRLFNCKRCDGVGWYKGPFFAIIHCPDCKGSGIKEGRK